MANLDAIKTSSKVLPAGQIVTHSTFSDTFPPAMRRQQRPIVLQMLQITAVKLPSHFLLFWDLLQWPSYWPPPTKKGENSPFRSADTPATDKKGTIVFAPPQWAVNLLQCPRHSPITSTRLKSSSATGKKDCLLMSLMFCSFPSALFICLALLLGILFWMTVTTMMKGCDDGICQILAESLSQNFGFNNIWKLCGRQLGQNNVHLIFLMCRKFFQ